MPSFAISKFTVLLETLWVSAEFLLLSTDPLLYIIAAAAAVLYSCRPLLQLYTVFQLCACHPLTSNMTVASPEKSHPPVPCAYDTTVEIQ